MARRGGLPVPELGDGSCQVWWERRTALPPGSEQLLDRAERARAVAYRRAADRERFVLGCVLTRTVVAAHLAIAPADVVLDRTCPDCGRPHGKVRCVGADLELSVSRSGELVVVAVRRGTPIGIDVERIGLARDHAGLAAAVLTSAERAWLRELPPAGHADAFATYWTRKEAIVKATGEGLRARLDEIATSPPDKPARLLAHRDRPDLVGGLQLYDLHVGGGYRAALAVLDARRAPVLQLQARRRLAPWR